MPPAPGSSGGLRGGVGSHCTDTLAHPLHHVSQAQGFCALLILPEDTCPEPWGCSCPGTQGCSQIVPFCLSSPSRAEGAAVVLILHLGQNNPTHPVIYLKKHLLDTSSVPGSVPGTGYKRGKNTKDAILLSGCPPPGEGARNTFQG